ncbi:MAG: hypothetical protein DWQ19_10900 [Crenarchaeota archaeon]|nr:MAG: hypothetical protein DWQ19_10900 [Thermoproteota archaeon]
MKICSKCKLELPFDSFSKHSRSKDGLYYCCKICKAKEDREYRARHRDKIKKKKHLYYEQNKDHIKCKTVRYQKHNPDKVKAYSKTARENLKIEIFNHYCNCNIECKNCGQNQLHLLTVDHVNGGGSQHKRRIKNLYSWIKRNNFPEGFQVLCWNCQFRKKNEEAKPENPQPNQIKQAEYVKNIKKEVLSHYGTTCSCGESDDVVLTLDHINDNGAEHRKKLGRRGFNFYLWLRKNNFPNDPPLQVLCANCQYDKHNLKPRLFNSETHLPEHKVHLEIASWLDSFGLKLEDKTIEYCDFFWHTQVPERYHYNKYKEYLENNVQLITIFEDEWNDRRSQCESHILSLFGIKERTVFARKCSIVDLNKVEFNKFCDAYHIQGSNRLGLIFYGLEFKGELLGVMSLGRHHRQVKTLVLDRLCFKRGVQIPGGASKLFSRCIEWAKINNYSDIISFSDNRWSLGGVYKALNFQLDKELPPDYSYVDLKNGGKRLSKQSQKKKNTNCPSGMTEKEWALERGLVRIWDCGKKRWVYNIH